MGISLGVRHIMNIDFSKYPFFSGEIRDFSRLPVQGFCNENYSFEMDNQRYLLRKFKVQNIDREFEYKVQTLASEKNIAAKPILLDEENALMICHFLKGYHKRLLDRNNIKDIAKLLKKLHMIQIDQKAIKLDDLFDKKSEEIIEAMDIVKNYQSEFVLCHNDLNPQNILFSKEVRLIDWEFAAVNDRYFDLASLCVEFKLDKNEETYLLETYFMREEEIHREKLNAYKTIYTTACKQWFDKSDLNTLI